MRVGSLFSGIGGFDLGLERAGFEVEWQCDNDPFCNKVLAHHWPGVRRFSDVSTASVALADDNGCCLECGERLADVSPFVSKAVTVRAEDDAILQAERSTLALGDDVVGVALRLSPTASHTAIAVESDKGLVPSALVGVGSALSDEVRLAAIPGASALDAAPMVTDREALISGDFPAATTGALIANHEINCTKLHWVDVIVGGFPCQDLSVAGLRKGLQASRSGLFFQFMRIVQEMRDASNGRFPTAVIAENVPGLFSSASGRDFGVVLNALVECGAVDIAWRVIDSQHWVPQRRRRVFIVAVFPPASHGRDAIGRAAEVLSLCEGCGGHPAAGREAREDVTGPVSGGAYGSGRRTEDDPNLVLANPLMASGRGTERTGDSRGQDTLVTGALRARDHKGIGFEAEQFLAVNHSLRADGFDASEDGTGRGTPIVAIQERAVSENPDNGPGGKGWRDDGIAYTLEARNKVQSVAAATVRRLTPTECERLQGFPDGWTDVDGAKDGPRYKALGNAVTVPVIEYLGRRIMAVLS